MTAADVKDALRRRYPATQYMGSRIVPGGWTVIEEYRGIDVLAFSAHASPQPRVGARYPRVGHEVKVSRSDLRRELLNPQKRARSVAWCNAFFFVVPAGLLSKDELAYIEPQWGPADFAREPCPLAWSDFRRPCRKGRRAVRRIGPLSEFESRFHSDTHPPLVEVACESCEGRGYLDRSRVEREAPTCWVPTDVGLIEVSGGRCRIVRRAPVRHEVPAVEGPTLCELVRWVSARPDPRHSETQVARATEVAA